MSKHSFSKGFSLLSVLVASVCGYGCIGWDESPGTEDTVAEAQEELSSDVREINDERPAAEQAAPLECDQTAGTVLEHTDDSGWFAQRISLDELSSAVDQGDAQSPQNDAAPSNCNGQDCNGCAGTCWFAGKPVAFSGKRTWDSSKNVCYCVGPGNYWNCCW
jgi:hypothetical protein